MLHRNTISICLAAKVIALAGGVPNTRVYPGAEPYFLGAWGLFAENAVDHGRRVALLAAQRRGAQGAWGHSTGKSALALAGRGSGILPSAVSLGAWAFVHAVLRSGRRSRVLTAHRVSPSGNRRWRSWVVVASFFPRWFLWAHGVFSPKMLLIMVGRRLCLRHSGGTLTAHGVIPPGNRRWCSWVVVAAFVPRRFLWAHGLLFTRFCDRSGDPARSRRIGSFHREIGAGARGSW